MRRIGVQVLLHIEFNCYDLGGDQITVIKAICSPLTSRMTSVFAKPAAITRVGSRVVKPALFEGVVHPSPAC